MITAKTALITGITGQDGSYLAELLLDKGYNVHGIIRRSSSFNTGRIDHIYQDPHNPEHRLHLHYGDLTDTSSLEDALRRSMPDEVYHLGAQSHVRVSFDQPVYSMDVDGLGTLRLLEAVRRIVPQARVYQASSSEMFGSSPPPQNEDTPFRPRSPYAIAKVASHHVAQHYRERGLWVATGILFNHESPRRGETFVTRKVTRAVARIKLGFQKELYLGNLYARRDWGWAPEYVKAMWMILQHSEPDDFVIATGVSWSVRDLVERAFEYIDRDWRGYVHVDPRYSRPTDVPHLCGDPSKARRILGWRHEATFREIVGWMVQADLRLANPMDKE